MRPVRPTLRAAALLLPLACAHEPAPSAAPTRPADPCAPSGEPGIYAVEIVDPAATAAIAQALDPPYDVKDEAAFTRALSTFYASRGDDFDFLYLYIPDPHHGASGLHINIQPRWERTLGVFSRGMPEISARWPRLRSALAIALDDDGGGGPSLHELLHYWASGLGRGEGLGFPSDMHWGATGVGGQLGGFDGDRLRCVEPPDARPPACTRDAEGRYQVHMPPFATYAGGGDYKAYAPLELWLMGLLPAEEVPPVPMLVDARRLNPPSALADGLYSVSDVRMVTVQEITQAMGGPPPPRIDADRQLRVGFVLVDAAPDPEGLARLQQHARRFAGVELAPYYSFCRATRGRATIRADL